MGVTGGGESSGGQPLQPGDEKGIIMAPVECYIGWVLERLGYCSMRGGGGGGGGGVRSQLKLYFCQRMAFRRLCHVVIIQKL